jgi:hypothetical protein
MMGAYAGGSGNGKWCMEYEETICPADRWLAFILRMQIDMASSCRSGYSVHLSFSFFEHF